MIDQITLTIPREPDFNRVAHLVLGGLAARLDLTIESLEDLQLALDALLDRLPDPTAPDDDLTVTMSLREHELEMRVGPLSEVVLDELERDGGVGIDLRRVLESTVDDLLVDGDGVVLTKQVSSGG